MAQESQITFDANEFHFKKLQLRGSFASPALFTPMALNLIKTGVIDASAMITHTFPLEELQKAMTVAATNKAEAIKVVIK